MDFEAQGWRRIPLLLQNIISAQHGRKNIQPKI